MRAAAIACLLLAGCSSTTAVNLTIQLGGDVAARQADLATLALHVDGDAAPFDHDIDVHGKFGSGRETLQYLPKVKSGTLDFTVTLTDDSAAPIGRGMASIPLKTNGSVALTIPIGSDGGGGGAEDLAGADLSLGPDAAMPTCSRIQVSTLAGTGAAGYMDGAGNVAQFQMLEGIAVDQSGTLYVAEAAHVRKVLADGTVSTFSSGTFLQARRLSRANIAAEWHVADSANDQVYRVPNAGGAPAMYLVQGGVITVTDNPGDSKSYLWDTQTCKIQTTNASNMLITYSGAGCGLMDGSAGTAQFTSVPDLIFDSAGGLWVADQFRIRRVATDGSVTTIAGSTQGSTDGTGTAAQFNGPLGITVDNVAHNLYVTDGTTIRLVTPAGAVTTIVGTTSGFVDGTGCVAKFGALKGIAYFAGALYAVDVERIRKIVLP